MNGAEVSRHYFSNLTFDQEQLLNFTYSGSRAPAVILILTNLCFPPSVLIILITPISLNPAVSTWGASWVSLFNRRAKVSRPVRRLGASVEPSARSEYVSILSTTIVQQKALRTTQNRPDRVEFGKASPNSLYKLFEHSSTAKVRESP